MSIKRNKVQKAAQKQYRKRNWSKALREYKKLVEDDPTDMRSLLKCGDLHVKLDDEEQALEAYKAVADNYAQQEMYEKAIAVYKQALRLDPDEVVLHHAVAECYYRLGRLKDAVRTFHKVQQMYKERGEHDSQREILEHMVRIDPDDVGLRIQLAERYTKDNLEEQALQSFRYCAETLEQEGRLDELVQVRERILFLTPERFDLRKKVVRMYLDRQDNQAALKHLQICFKKAPKDVETLEMLAQTFERLERTEKAVMVLEELIPQYEEANRQSDLENLYRRLLRLDPDNEKARKGLGHDVRSDRDSGVVTGPQDTDSLSQRQNTPAPAKDDLDDVEFLDDDIEFLDDDLVGEVSPASSEASPPPSGSAPAQPPPTSPTPPDTKPASPPEAPPPPEVPNRAATKPGDPEDIPELTADVEMLDEDSSPAPTFDESAQDSDDETRELDVVDPLEIQAVDESAPASEEEVRQILGECDVFIKYGLYDKASNAIAEALEASPESLFAHQTLLELHEATGNTQEQYRTLITLAELTEHAPLRAYDYLQQALEIAPNPDAVRVRGKALGIDVDGPPPTDSVDELAIESLEPIEEVEPAEKEVEPVAEVEPVEEPKPEPDTLHVELEAIEEDEEDDSEVADHAPAPPERHDEPADLSAEAEPAGEEDPSDLFGDALDGLGDAIDSFSETTDDAPSSVVDDDTDPESVPATGDVEIEEITDEPPPPEPTAASDDIEEISAIPQEDQAMLEQPSSPLDFDTDAEDESEVEQVDGLDPDTDAEAVIGEKTMELDIPDGPGDELVDLDFDTDTESLDDEMDSVVMSDEELDFGDADDIVEMDLVDDEADIDDSELQALDATSEAEAEEEGPGVDSLFSDVEADDLFGNLFGDEDGGADLGLGTEDDDEEMAQIDFLIQQGLADEARHELQQLEADNPAHPGIEARRAQIQQLESGEAAQENPFGAQSLSQRFSPNTASEDSTDDDTGPINSVVNSNLELGVAYRDMGLLDEAIDEFNQAAEDPEAAASAYYNIGLCKMDLDQPQAARSTFHKVLEMDDIAPDVRSAAREKLDELEAQAS